jgi:sporulation protein YlmC with PRC-barrel domain
VAKPDRIFASELLEREVMDLRAGEIVGAVTDFNVTREGVVTQLGVLPLQWYRGGWGIAPGAITNVTRERVSIEDSTLLDEFAPDGEASLSAMLGDNVYGKAVLAADGELLGHLADFAFDLEDGQITDLVVFGDDDKRIKIGVESIQTIGKSYIVISRAGSEVQPGPKMAAPGASDTSVSRPAAAANKFEIEEAEQPELEDDDVETGDDWGPTTYEPELEEEPAEGAAEEENATPAVAEISAPAPAPLPAVDKHSGGAALAPEPPLETPPIVEEIGVTVAPPETKKAPAARKRAATAAKPAAKTATGRSSRVDSEKATGRGSRADAEKATGRASRARPTTPKGSEQQLAFGAEGEPVPAQAETLDGLGLSTFDLRKAQYLLGKGAHRDIRGADGKLILTRGTPFNRGRISALVEQGLLNSVFLEMTQHKG